MFDLEKNIKDNLAYFNEKEPDQGHRDRFASRLTENLQPTKRINLSLFSKIAAAILLIIATSYFVFDSINSSSERDNLFITQIEYSDELTNIQSYYDELSQTALLQFDEFAPNEEQALLLKKKAKKKMDNLDANLAMIEKEYVKNPQCEKLKEAIITNKKMKVEIVNNMIDQMGNAQRGYHAGSIYTNF